MSEDPDSGPFTGPVKDLRKRVLVSVATALALPTDGKKDNLIERINSHLAQNAELADNPRFQGLFSYRPERKNPTKYTKTSLDKAAEDCVEEEKASQAAIAASGANKTLLELKVTSDPPPQFARLDSLPSGDEDESELEDDQSSLPPGEHQAPVNVLADADIPADVPQPTSTHTGLVTVGDVRVPEAPPKLAEDSGPREAVEETPRDSNISPTDHSAPAKLPTPTEEHNKPSEALEVPSEAPSNVAEKIASEKPASLVTLTQALNNLEQHKMSLTAASVPQVTNGPASDADQQLIVVSFHSVNTVDSPPEEVYVRKGVHIPLIKEPGKDGTTVYKTRLSRLIPDAIDSLSPKKPRDARLLRPGHTTGRIQLGTIDAVMSGASKQLSLDPVDMYQLEESELGFLVCNLFVDEGKTTAVAGGLAKPSIMDDPDVKPLEVAKLRKEARAAKSKAKSTVFWPVDEDVLTWLRTFLDIGQAPSRADTIGVALQRHLALQGAYTKLTEAGWSRIGGGWLLPETHERFPNLKLTKNDVQKAFRIQHSVASSDALLFKLSELKEIPGVAGVVDWINDPTGPEAGVYEDMSVAKFKKYLQDEKKRAVRKKKKKLKREAEDSEEEQRKAKVKKRRAAESSDSDSGSSSSSSSSAPSEKPARKKVKKSDSKGKSSGHKGDKASSKKKVSKGKEKATEINSDELDDSD